MFEKAKPKPELRRARVTPAKRGRGGQSAKEDREEPTPAERRAAMTWAQRLKRVFGIDIETCPACGGAVRCESSRALRTPTSSRRSPPTWVRKRRSPKAPGGRHAGRRPKRVCSNDQSMTRSFAGLHHPLTQKGFARTAGVEVPKYCAKTRPGSWGSGRNPHPQAISPFVCALRIHVEIRKYGLYVTYTLKMLDMLDNRLGI